MHDPSDPGGKVSFLSGLDIFEGNVAGYKFLIHNWAKLSLWLNDADCDHVLTIESSDTAKTNMCRDEKASASYAHNNYVIVPNNLLNDMTPEALMNFCKQQQKSLEGDCSHNKSCGQLTISIENVPCVEPCDKILSCGHKCKKLCADECSPCMEFVKVNHEKCFHSQEVRCGTIPPDGLKCDASVTLNEPGLCGHLITVQCHQQIDLKGPVEIMKVCTAPCTYTGPCGHPCEGTCKDCYQGKFHIRCMYPCNRILDCGHRCESSCCDDFEIADRGCPPCVKPCEAYCTHGACPDICGLPCKPCLEQCDWECAHSKCSKLCSESCDREMCFIRCDKKLGCGCKCIGYCGEPCPPLCRNCDKDVLSGFLILGYELEDMDEYDCFIFLEHCGHTIEILAMQHLMTTEVADQTTIPKTCPMCRGVIWNCHPFNDILHKKRDDILQAKKNQWGNESRLEALQLDNFLKLTVSERRDGHENNKFNYFRLYLISTFCLSNVEVFIKVNLVTMIDVQSLVNVYTEAEKRMIEFQKIFLDGQVKLPICYHIMLHYYHRFFNWVITRQPPFRRTELEDICKEVRRIDDLHQLVRSRVFGTEPGENSNYSCALDILEMVSTYKPRMRAEFLRHFRKHYLEFCAQGLDLEVINKSFDDIATSTSWSCESDVPYD